MIQGYMVHGVQLFPSSVSTSPIPIGVKSEPTGDPLMLITQWIFNVCLFVFR